MARKSGLGRGFSALVGDGHSVESVTRVTEEDKRTSLRMLPVDQVHRGRYQPRRHFDPDALQELADSITAQGMVQPVVVRPVDAGYELIAGERRWRAAQIAGLAELPAVVRELEDQSAAAIALIENVQRQDLNPLEEARAIARLVQDFGLSHQQVATAVGRSRASVSNLLRLQELDDGAKEWVESGHLEMGHARALLSLSPARQRALARHVAERDLTVRATERLVKEELAGGGTPARAEKDPDTRRVEQDLSERLGAAVTIRPGRGGRGQLQIRYNSSAELEGILEHIR